MDAKNTEEEMEKRLQAEQTSYEQYIDYVNEIGFYFANWMEDTLKLNGEGTLHILHGKVERLGMKFNTPRRATIEEARELELLVINKFVELINVHEEIQPFLVETPFTYKHVQIFIGFERHNRRYADGTVSHVFNTPTSLSDQQNSIVYYAEDPFTYKSIELLEEPYAEAVGLQANSPIKDPSVHQEKGYELAIDACLDHFGEEIFKEFGLKTWAIGGKMINGIEELAGSFILFKPASQEEARQLLVAITEKLLSMVNSNDVLIPYLKQYPFSPNLVRINIDFRTERHHNYYDDSMDSIKLENGAINYYKKTVYAQTEDNTYYDTTLFASESYQEALKASPVSLDRIKPSIYDPLLAWLHVAGFYIIYYIAYIFYILSYMGSII